MARRTRRTKPLPEPADATFTVLLRETVCNPNAAWRRRAWARLIDHLIADESDADQDELRELIAYCHERIDLLNSRDADFIVSVKRVAERYAVTPRQRRWALDIVHRLLLLEREAMKDRGRDADHGRGWSRRDPLRRDVKPS
jgi:hypothetical protein